MMKIIASCLMWIISRAINPAILRCYGWKYESDIFMGMKFECWVDPESGMRCEQSIAIKLCENRIK